MDEKRIALLKSSLGDAELIETHISWLLLDGSFVYKIKKPVKFSFLDFSTLEKRKYFCNEEVTLNRRLSPEIYIGVVPVVETNNGIFFGDRENIIEHAVKMKRMPQEQRMDVLLGQGKVTEAHIRKLAEIVADFHSRIGAIRNKRYGSAEIVKRHIDDIEKHRNTIEVACGFGRKVDLIVEKSGEFIRKNSALFKKRQEEGRVMDCHGDLHSANIFITDSIVIFDCIEFSRDFRYIDVANEVAFMAMDLEAHEREDLADIFVQAYLAKTQDTELKTLLPFYKCYRANVRAKVAAIDFSQHQESEARERIAKYIQLAERYALSL